MTADVWLPLAGLGDDAEAIDRALASEPIDAVSALLVSLISKGAHHDASVSAAHFALLDRQGDAPAKIERQGRAAIAALDHCGESRAARLCEIELYAALSASRARLSELTGAAETLVIDPADTLLSAASLRLRGGLLRASGDLRGSLAALERARLLSAESGSVREILRVKNTLGSSYAALGITALARDALEEARELADISGQRQSSAIAAGQLATLALDSGDPRLASRHLVTQRSIAAHLGDIRGLARSHSLLVEAFAEQGDVRAARQSADSARSLYAASPTDWTRLQALMATLYEAESALASGDRVRAEELAPSFSPEALEGDPELRVARARSCFVALRSISEGDDLTTKITEAFALLSSSPRPTWVERALFLATAIAADRADSAIVSRLATRASAVLEMRAAASSRSLLSLRRLAPEQAIARAMALGRDLVLTSRLALASLAPFDAHVIDFSAHTSPGALDALLGRLESTLGPDDHLITLSPPASARLVTANDRLASLAESTLASTPELRAVRRFRSTTRLVEDASLGLSLACAEDVPILLTPSRTPRRAHFRAVSEPSPSMIFYALYALVRNFLRVLISPLILLMRRRASPPGAYLHLLIDGGVVEMRPARSRLPWAPKPRGIALNRLRELVDTMLADPRPAGLLVTIRSLSASAAFRTALRAELLRLRVGGKPVVIHLPHGGSSAELLIASAGTRVILGAETGLGPLGFRAGGIYLRKALDKAGLVPDVFAQGAYKSAGESLTRDEMSEPQREQLGRLLDVWYEELITALVEGRGLDRERAVAAIDRGLLSAADAVTLGLADITAHDDELANIVTGSEHGSLISAAGYLDRRSARVWKRVLPQPKIAVIELHGPIVERSPGRFGEVCDADKIVPLLGAAAKSPFVTGVVLHIDSPGGGVLASEKIHRAIARLAAEKPVVACFGGVSASGGYYVAAAAHLIVSQPTTITGSIGVVAARVVAGPLLEKLGVSPSVLTRGAHADLMNITRPFDAEERALFDIELARAYRHFVELVAAGRNRTPEEILPLAGGRVWSGIDAFHHGLVDRLGGLPEAIAEVRARGDQRTKKSVPMLIAPRTPLRPSLLSALLPGAQLLESLGLGSLVHLAEILAGSRERILALWSQEL